VTAFSLEELATGARFLTRLPGFLRHRLSPEEARVILRRRLARRADDFIALARGAIYGNPRSPYRALLRLAGCELGDLEQLVHRHGVEHTLVTLLRAGVYLRIEEFKGRLPVIRGGTRITLDHSGLRNPKAGAPVFARTGGSRGAAMPLLVDLDFIRDRAVTTALTLEARGGLGWHHASWGVPGGAIVRILDLAVAGRPPARWFSPTDPRDVSLHLRYRWSARAIRWVGMAAGTPLPIPEYVPPEHPEPIVGWIAELLRAGRTPHIHTFASLGVRLCRTALATGVDIGGARLTLSGEPVTDARLAETKRAGVEAAPCYSTMETGPIGYGCLAPAAADDVHLLHDMHALVQPGPENAPPGVAAEALFLSSLRPTASPILLNVSLGDEAVAAGRACGCPLEALGWTTHLHAVRSREKLTAGGTTFLDTDAIRVLDEVLPRRFGGGPTDYQLVEGTDGDGRPVLHLRVHPQLGPVSLEAVANTFLAELGGGVGAERIMSALWRNGRVLRVERTIPVATASGKILHLHVEPRQPA
jgi:hypothetical protein